MSSKQISANTGRLSALICGIALFLLFFFSILAFSNNNHPLSGIDEHVHMDYAVTLQQGELPYRGATYTDAVVDKANCGTGLVVPSSNDCSQGTADIALLLDGEYSSAYIHYPTFFVGGATFASLFGEANLLSSLRTYSAIVSAIGLLAVAGAAFTAGLRGWRLLASCAVAICGHTYFLMASSFNPSSANLLAGGLIAAATLNWVLRDRGFWWLVAATLLASCLAVTSALPVGAPILLVLIAVACRWVRRPLPLSFQPQWWHAVILSVAVIAPVIAWGRYIAATATASNADLYSFTAFQGWRRLFQGALSELFLPHLPWNGSITAGGTVGAAGQLGVGLANTAPVLLGALAFGGLVLLSVQHLSQRAARPGLQPRFGQRLSGSTSTITSEQFTLAALAACVLLVMMLYPPALRISNALTFGIDHPIVARYSMAFSPLLAILLMKLNEHRAYVVIVSAVAVVSALAYSIVGFTVPYLT